MLVRAGVCNNVFFIPGETRESRKPKNFIVKYCSLHVVNQSLLRQAMNGVCSCFVTLITSKISAFKLVVLVMPC